MSGTARRLYCGQGALHTRAAVVQHQQHGHQQTPPASLLVAHAYQHQHQEHAHSTTSLHASPPLPPSSSSASSSTATTVTSGGAGDGYVRNQRQRQSQYLPHTLTARWDSANAGHGGVVSEPQDLYFYTCVFVNSSVESYSHLAEPTHWVLGS
ncbi:hypothetical protein B0H16DRAFT_132029 [Mycena metata]|uniref:Uncharacterized protein n=1 Tax=Mycena metata TaxID=1033252 RepID=A0AAD7I693_9AGAR|nr:hypothetical protein B0H16DRAFT_132029 [Mycena metata]